MGGWVRRAAPPTHGHICTLPAVLDHMRRVIHTPADARWGDLWRCHFCRRLWRVGDACPVCDSLGGPAGHGGQCAYGLRWYPAKWWQRLWYWRPWAR